jgi:hypothetical protein
MESPLVSFQDGEELNRARLIPDNLYVKSTLQSYGSGRSH